MPRSILGGDPPPSDIGDVIAGLRRFADEERQRAARAEAVAAHCQARAASGPEYLRSFRARMAAAHWGTRERHLVSAGLHEMHATRLEAWLSGGHDETLHPLFLSSVAAAIGMESAAAEVRGHRPATVIAASSDATARAARDLERALGEGPTATAIAARVPVKAAGSSLVERWPLYGAAVGKLGVRAVIAVPLQSDAGCLGALSAYGAKPDIEDATATIAGRIAEALTNSMLRYGEPLFGEPDDQAVVHQAARMLSVRFGCEMGDAEAVIRTRAFAQDRPVEALAARVLRGEPLAEWPRC